MTAATTDHNQARSQGLPPSTPQERILRSSELQSPFASCWGDIVEGWGLRTLWFRLGYLEVKRRYRRTVIGPFWATGHIAIYIACVGFIFSSVLATDRQSYIPYLTTGFIAWMFIYNTLQEASGAFISASSLRQQLPFPYSVFIFLLLWRNLIVHIHNYSLYILILIIYPIDINLNLLLLIPGYFLIIANLTWIALLIATLAARFRDVQQLVASVIQVMIFVTPVFWSPEMMSATKRIFVLMPNLLYHLSIVIRSPLLGQTPPWTSYVVLITSMIVGWVFTAWFFGRRRSHVVFWIM